MQPKSVLAREYINNLKYLRLHFRFLFTSKFVITRINPNYYSSLRLVAVSRLTKCTNRDVKEFCLAPVTRELQYAQQLGVACSIEIIRHCKPCLLLMCKQLIYTQLNL